VHAPNPHPPLPTHPSDLNIVGGRNFHDDTPDALRDDPRYWSDTDMPTSKSNGYHGTHVAGVIGALNNGVGSWGVQPGAKIFSATIFRGSTGARGKHLLFYLCMHA
jgi:subtilisin family serine protease